MHKIYQMDYSRKTGEFRMLDHILPKVLRSVFIVRHHTDDRAISGDRQSRRYQGAKTRNEGQRCLAPGDRRPARRMELGQRAGQRSAPRLCYGVWALPHRLPQGQVAQEQDAVLRYRGYTSGDRRGRRDGRGLGLVLCSGRRDEALKGCSALFRVVENRIVIVQGNIAIYHFAFRMHHRPRSTKLAMMPSAVRG